MVLISCISYFSMAMIKYLTKETSERSYLGSQFENVVHHHRGEDVLARVAVTGAAEA